MIKSIKIVSLFIVFCCCCILVDLYFSEKMVIVQQNNIIDCEYNYNGDVSNYYEYSSDYVGYIYIPKFDLRKLIVYGTSSSILDNLYVGMYEFSACLECDDLIILAGHNVPSVFNKLHFIDIDDVVYINTKTISRKFYVYDKRVVSDSEINYLYESRSNELLLITCTDRKNERLLVFLREDL